MRAQMYIWPMATAEKKAAAATSREVGEEGGESQWRAGEKVSVMLKEAERRWWWKRRRKMFCQFGFDGW